MSKHRNKKHQKKNPNFFDQQKAFGDWKNLLEPPITLAENLTKITITPNSPDGFLKSLEEYNLVAEVRATQQY